MVKLRHSERLTPRQLFPFFLGDVYRLLEALYASGKQSEHAFLWSRMTLRDLKGELGDA